MLLLGSAEGLFAAPGCPACRYIAESSGNYLNWFALEGHADPDVLQRLCASRGMCARHTRRLLAQPGAAVRLTAVYRYVVMAAADDPGAAAARCPACVQEAAAGDRVLSALLDELATGKRPDDRAHGGLCLPHLRQARWDGRGADVRWLVRFVIARLDSTEPDLDLLAGGPDLDADGRARLRAALPSHCPAGACAACWRAAARECDHLNVLARAVAGGPQARPTDSLCARHLRDAEHVSGLLAGQARREAQRLSQAIDGKPRRLGISPGWLSPRARRALAEPDCPVCHSSAEAATTEIRQVGAWLRHARSLPAAGVPLCLRDVIRLRTADPVAGSLAVRLLTTRCHDLAAQLDAEFSIRIQGGQNAGAGEQELTAWRRAAAFIDGSVFGGSHPGPPGAITGTGTPPGITW